jgi:predicted Ser/Thr protein kinase
MSNTAKLSHCPNCHLPIPPEAPQGLCPKCVLLGAATAPNVAGPATATSEIPSLERLAAAFPQLEVVELIGRGGMGFVFKARQPHLDRFVALKLLPDKLAHDPRFAERFNREGRVLARLNHPHIVSVYDFGQTGGFYYLLMEYVDGVNLRQAMQAGRFSPGEALAIVPEICGALQYAHEQGILHRDIKPENILLDGRGRVKIADFGIAKLVGEERPPVTLTHTGAALGTPHYMAPEQLEKPGDVDHRADIYSLGVVFYEMLTGELPIGRFAAPSSKTPVGASVDEVVFRTLEKDRERRFQSAGEMKTQVEGLGATGAAPSPPPVLRPPLPAGVKRMALLLCGLGVVAFIPTLLSFALGAREKLFCVTALLGVTGWALLVRQPWLRILALVLNGVGLMPVVLSLVRLLADGGSWPRFPLMGAGMGPGNWVLIGTHLGASLAAFWVLLRRDVAVLFPPRQGRLPGNISTWATLGAVLVAISLFVPAMVVTAMLARQGGIGAGELWLALGSIAFPGLGGTLLGWFGLNEIRENRGQVRGLPFALFATLWWPLALLIAVTMGLPMFWVMPSGSPTELTLLGRFLVLLVPAGAITFALWAVHATRRWALGLSASDSRPRILKWVFLGVLAAGIGVVLMFESGRPASAPRPKVNIERSIPDARETVIGAEATPPADENPMIQFTFTSIDLREENGAHWLAMQFVQQERGGCERVLRFENTVPGFTAQTRTEAARSDGLAGFKPVTHQRVLWKLPPLAAPEAAAFRDEVARQWNGKSVVIPSGDWETLFRLPTGGGALTGAIGTKLADNQRVQ